ncbi:aspartate ammonia-lyase [Candidatus Bathyarchaeota archaeon]|nr:aspartate ammonia-lyase [Candidatus Bathyarchaeota archaeon]
MKNRIEIDPLGKKAIPKDAYYGIQTLRAVENFPVSGIKEPRIFIKSYIMIKKAAAITNANLGNLDSKIKDAIVKACDEILAGNLLNQFVVDVFQAGAGTSFNMNVNEVLANRALEILQKSKGDYLSINPNDHVNMSQSTNDTFPTAVNISILFALQPLIHEIQELSNAFNNLSLKHIDDLKSGRTHLQDAVPITIGDEFGAYSSVLRNSSNQINKQQNNLYEIALGGTAVGTGANTHPKYKLQVIKNLRKVCGFPIKAAKNPFEALQSCRSVQTISSALKELALELIRISNDLRLLSSGPTTGLNEITLPAVQPGSSIMPGKVNPVMAECMNMIGFEVLGNDLTVSFAAQAGQLDLNVMLPVIVYKILSSISILTNYLPIFRKKCIEGIQVNITRCLDFVENNPSLATFLAPHIGYLKASEIAKKALKEGRSIKEIALEKKILTKKKLDEILDSKNFIGK